ncbi:MAG: hypothetical protein JSS57_14980 [Proteobacteria bacterium]|nr:hypothetical protein [Pseudomonadota bacterium]
MKKIASLGTAFATLAAMQGSAYAIDTGIDWLKVSGFGSLIASHANVDGANAYYQPSMTADRGIHDNWSVGTDSRLGLQADARINSALSATLQLVSRRNEKGEYTPQAEWANVKYRFTPDVSVRVGRVGLPAFLISDYMNVGYSQPWIRPPVEAYRMMPMSHVDGVDGIVRFHNGDSTISLQATYGKSDFKAVLAGGVVSNWDVDDVVGASVVFENGPWTLRYGKVYAKNKSTLIAGQKIEDDFNNVGLIYDPGNWLVQGEYIWRKTNSINGFGVQNQKMGYLTTGYRFGEVMPSVTYSRFVDLSDTGLLGTSQSSVGVGIRWDIYKNVALKTQLDHVTRTSAKAGAGYLGSFNTQPLYMSPTNPFASDDKSVNVASVGLDFVF